MITNEGPNKTCRVLRVVYLGSISCSCFYGYDISWRAFLPWNMNSISLKTMGLHLFSALPFPVTCLGDRWRVSVGRWIEQVEVDVFMIACWALDVFKWLCGCDGQREQWRHSPVNFATGARWMAAVNKDHAVFLYFSFYLQPIFRDRSKGRRVNIYT